MCVFVTSFVVCVSTFLLFFFLKGECHFSEVPLKGGRKVRRAILKTRVVQTFLYVHHVLFSSEVSFSSHKGPSDAWDLFVAMWRRSWGVGGGLSASLPSRGLLLSGGCWLVVMTYGQVVCGASHLESVQCVRVWCEMKT